MTAKTPAKVHLRLRFLNLGKPRTAGLCGREGSLCDHLSLSCFLFPPRKNRERRRKCSHTNVSMHRSYELQGSLKRRRKHPHPTSINGYHTVKMVLAQSSTNGPHSLSFTKVGTHSALGERSHTSAHRAKQGCVGWGRYLYPRSVLRGSETLRGQGVERQTVPLLGLGRGHSRRTQRACGTAMRLCASLSRGVEAPLSCVICLQLGDVAVFSLCAQHFLNMRGGGGITTLGVLRVLLKRRTAA